jgi:long-chain acyl-CoA synthetase
VELKPTILCGVPRVFSKVHQRVFAGVAEKNCLVKWYFKKAYEGQAKNLRLGKKRSEKYDNKIFIPLRTRMGLGNVRLLVTGAAPCPPYLLEFLRIVTGAVCCQGYGTTEVAYTSARCV